MDQGNNHFSKIERIVQDHNHEHEHFTTEIPVTIDRRAPQYNEANSSSHCTCPCARAAADGDTMEDIAIPTLDMKTPMNREHEANSSAPSSEYGEETVDYDEGAESHLIEVGDFGLVPLELIHRSLAKHSRCTCHHGMLPVEDDYPFTTFNSPSASGFLTPGDSASMIVEATNSSSDHSMASSQVLSICSRGSSLLEFMEGAFTQVPIFRPLALTPELGFSYPITIDLSQDNFNDFDMW